MRHGRLIATVCGLMTYALSPATAQCAKPALLSVTTSTGTHQAKLLNLGSEYCWIIDQTGRQFRLKVKQITQVKRLRSQFEPFSNTTIRDQLRRELGRDYSVIGKGRFLVCARPGTAEDYAQLFDQVYRKFYSFFSTRGFDLHQPEFPLVAIVIDDRKRFENYCETDGVTPSASLSGYYLRDSNRVVLSVSSAAASHSHRSPSDGRSRRGTRVDASRLLTPLIIKPAPATDADTVFDFNSRMSIENRALGGTDQNTIIHETTHQVAFNIGIHSRVSPSPQWVIEGLATTFEAPGIRDSLNRTKSQINASRYIHFGNYLEQRRKKNALENFLASNELFTTSTLDAYSEAWALTYYLLKTRATDYATYLKLIAGRTPESPYSSQARLEDFRKAFGSNLPLFEAAYLRFIRQIK